MLAQLLCLHVTKLSMGWDGRYRPEAIRGFMHDRETLVLVARSYEVSGSNSEVAGFAVMTYSDVDAHLLLLAVSRPTPSVKE